MRFPALSIAIALIASPALAQEHQFVNGEPVVVRPDQAYILVRSFDLPGGALRGTTMFMPLLVRTLNADQLDSAQDLARKEPGTWTNDIESNVVQPLADHPYARKDGEAFMVVAVRPGTYVLGGVAVTNWASKSTGFMATSLCLGTVKFEAKPGVVTDLGAILTADDDKPTAIPELSKAVSGKARGFGPVPQTVAVRPASAASEMPDALKALPLVPADYRAVGPYPNYIGARIGRLAPLAGVLDYDKDGHVLDLRSGGEAGH
jgi:hypothetical protein